MMQVRVFSVPVSGQSVSDGSFAAALEKRVNDELNALQQLDRYINYCRIYPEGNSVLVYIAHTPRRRPPP